MIMRTSIKDLKRVVREAFEAPKPELRKVIAAMDPDQVSDDDYIDNETGEVYLVKGALARKSVLHPQDKVDRRARDIERRRTRDIELAAEEEAWRAEDDEWEATRAKASDDAEAAYQDACREYASFWVGDEHSAEAQDVASDAAEGFFSYYPRWKEWAQRLGLSRADIQSAVADYVYEAMTSFP